MTVQPGSRGTEVVPPKDLKLVSSTRLICTIMGAASLLTGIKEQVYQLFFNICNSLGILDFRFWILD
jgi:hypothetical protein